MSEVNKSARTLQGTVVSNKMTDSIVVQLDRMVKHPRYHKFVKRITRVHAHDKGNTSSIGDVVIIAECRPISKTKSWNLVEICKKSGESN